MQISITDDVAVMQVQVPGQMGPQGPQGIPGQANVLTIGTVTTLTPGSNAVATISGVSPNQTLNLSIPQGAKGDKGDTGATPTISSGTINTVQWNQPIVSTLTGTAPNYILNLSIPKGRGFTPRGAWAATTVYAADDLVTNGGSTYLCLTAHTSGATFSGPGANWQLWSSIGNTGPVGPANTLAIGTVTTGSTNTQAAATITGAAPNQTLNLTLPAGPMGATGATGPANTLSIGTVTTLATGSSASATITGTAPNQTLNLSIPTGPQGATGSAGAAANMTIGTVTTLAAGASATATITGTAPNYTLNLGIPQGAAGSGGLSGTGPATIDDSAGTASDAVLTLKIPTNSVTGSYLNLVNNGGTMLTINSVLNGGVYEPRIYSPLTGTSGALRYGNPNGDVRFLVNNDATTYVQTSQANFAFSGVNGTDGTQITFGFGTATFHGAVAVAGKITNVTNPTNPQDAATKSYVDAVGTRVTTLEGYNKVLVLATGAAVPGGTPANTVIFRTP